MILIVVVDFGGVTEKSKACALLLFDLHVTNPKKKKKKK
jgi:hypothetical protein